MPRALGVSREQSQALHPLEIGALTLGIVEIPLQLDKYYMYHTPDAEMGAVGGFNISITSISLVFLYGFWLLRSSTPSRRRRVGVIFGVPMLLYIGSVAFSSLSAQLPMLSYFDLFLLLQAYLLFFYVANRVRSKRDILYCCAAVALALFAQSLLIMGMKALRLDDARIELGPLILTVWEGERHGGSMQSPVLAGSTMALMWLPVAASLFCSFRGVEFGKWYFAFALICVVCGVIAILLTQTRGAILTSFVGMAIIGVAMLSRGWLPKWTLVVGVLIALVSIYPLWMVYEKRIRHGDDDSAIARKHLSLIALEMIQDRPLVGFGAGNCHLAAQTYADQGIWRSEWYYTIHSKYLLVWVETGLFGIATFLLVLGNGIRSGAQAWFGRDPFFAPLGIALAAALVGHMLHMAVDIFNSRTQVELLWLILGLTAAVGRAAADSRVELRQRKRSVSEFNRDRSTGTTIVGSSM